MVCQLADELDVVQNNPAAAAHGQADGGIDSRCLSFAERHHDRVDDRAAASLLVNQGSRGCGFKERIRVARLGCCRLEEVDSRGGHRPQRSEGRQHRVNRGKAGAGEDADWIAGPSKGKRREDSGWKG
jgi:hypothetical protein